MLLNRLVKSCKIDFDSHGTSWWNKGHELKKKGLPVTSKQCTVTTFTVVCYTVYHNSCCCYSIHYNKGPVANASHAQNHKYMFEYIFYSVITMTL